MESVGTGAALQLCDLGAAHEVKQICGKRPDDPFAQIVDYARRPGAVLSAREAVSADAEPIGCTHTRRVKTRHSLWHGVAAGRGDESACCAPVLLNVGAIVGDAVSKHVPKFSADSS